ncbi:signal peptide peptidase SppA [Pleurocapsales cyanobacterium LEGE 06147]|nr:signal peptide peptidase SppA [Pleurocapsales cyanobacterium LEGE 06147]
MSQFFKQTFASLIGTFAGLFLFFTLGASGLIVLMVVATSPPVEAPVKEKSILVFDLSMKIKDARTPTNLSQALTGEKSNVMTLRQVLQSLEKAIDDPHIVGLLLDGRRGEASISSGYANLAEVRAALERFRAGGKKIIAYDTNWSEREYYLASVADEAVINPMGIMEINGLSYRQIFFKGALDKYGIGVQVIRVGDYKSAVESYTRQNFSLENRQQTQALLADLWGNFLATVGESRSLSPIDLQKIADDKGFLNPTEAKHLGLVDRVAYFDKVVTDLKKLTEQTGQEGRSLKQISLENYATPIGEKAKNKLSNQKIAVIYAEGTIVNGKGGLEEIGSDRFARELRQLREDDSIKSIVLRINSPGGSATASEAILREILLTRKYKPVVVSMGNVAASGGYWIATGADCIFAEESTITGSIGVFGLLPNIQAIANNHGVTWDVVKTGRLADINSNLRPKTEEELAIYQQSVTQTYNLFLDKVAEYRNLPRQEVDQIAQGKVWSGKEGLKIGLVDRIGGLEAAIAYAAEKAKLGTDWQLEEYPKQRSLETEIVNRLLNVNIEAWQAKGQSDPITTELLKVKEELTIFQSLNDPRSIYARLPYNFDF